MYEWIAVSSRGWPCGMSHPNAKYTDSDVDNIRLLYKSGWKVADIARKMEMPRTTVSDLVHEKVRIAPVYCRLRRWRKDG